MLRREGWRENHKHICRLYSEQGLSLRLKRPRHNKPAQRRQPQLKVLSKTWTLSLTHYLTGVGYAC